MLYECLNIHPKFKIRLSTQIIQQWWDFTNPDLRGTIAELFLTSAEHCWANILSRKTNLADPPLPYIIASIVSSLVSLNHIQVVSHISNLRMFFRMALWCWCLSKLDLRTIQDQGAWSEYINWGMYWVLIPKYLHLISYFYRYLLN